MRERRKIMIMGLGELGGIVLEYLCRTPGIGEVIAADLNGEWGFMKTNSAVEGASYMGLYPRVQFHQLDLLDVEHVAEFLAKSHPEIIFNGTTLMPWWSVNELPVPVRAKLIKGKYDFAPWASVHLALPYRLMKAVRLSGLDPCVINSSYPDVINASLGRVGLAPTAGIGNVDLIVPYIQKAASERLNVPMRNVGVQLIAHHFHAVHWCRTGGGYEAPHYLRVYVGHEDVTDQLGDMEHFISELPKRCMRPAGRLGQFVVAASTVKNIMAIYGDTNELTHAPGPQGLEGGYPVRLSSKGAEVVPPQGMTVEAAREINVQAQRYDGVEEIRDNGDIVLLEEACGNLRETLGVDCGVISVENAHEQAMELKGKFGEFARRHGVDV